MIQETLNEVYLLYFFNKRSAPSCVIYTCQTSKTQEIFFFFPTSVSQYFYGRPPMAETEEMDGLGTGRVQ